MYTYIYIYIYIHTYTYLYTEVQQFVFYRCSMARKTRAVSDCISSRHFWVALLV